METKYFPGRVTEPEGGPEGCQVGATPHHGVTTPWSRLGVVIPFDLKTPWGEVIFQRDSRIAAATRNTEEQIRNSVLAPCRDGELEEIIAIIITDATPSTIHDSPIDV